MAKRYEIAELVEAAGSTNPYLRAVSGRAVTINDLRGEPLVVFTAETGAGVVAQPLTTDANGRIEGWVEAPDFDIAVSGADGYTQPIRTSPLGVFEVKSYGALGNAAVDAATKATNVAAFNAAIAAANTVAGVVVSGVIEVAAGIYYFTDGATLTTLSGAKGFVGVPGTAGSVLIFNTDGDCIVAKGESQRWDGLYVRNDAAVHSAHHAVIRIKNCAYGDFANLVARSDGANSVGIMLEQVYEDPATDAQILAHYGCWYNTFRNVAANYGVNGSTFSNTGDGISFEVNANALGVVNPPGVPANTYNGSVQFNEVIGFNIEGKDRGINLDRASCNHFIGGQLIGCNDQVHGDHGSSSNTFIGTKLNQWTTNAFNFIDGASTSNVIINPIPFNTVGGPPYSLGNLGVRAVVVSSDESVADNSGAAAIGAAKIGRSPNLGATWMELRHVALVAANSYALAQNSAANGPTIVNAQNGGEVQLRINNANVFRVGAAGVGANGAAPSKPVLNYSRAGAGETAAAAAIRGALAALGFITDSTVA